MWLLALAVLLQLAAVGCQLVTLASGRYGPLLCASVALTLFADAVCVVVANETLRRLGL